MTEDQFSKTRFRSCMEISYSQRGKVIECMLLSVDFEEGLLRIIPMDKITYNDESIWVRCENCEIPVKSKLKILK